MPPGRARPSLFIGSSTEGLDFARAARACLESDAEVTLWNEGVFALGQTFIEGLTEAVSRFDFALLVLTPDDLVQSRAAESIGPRDNVLFELGLFMGRLGRERTFILHRAEPGLRLPSDLAGLSTAQYHWPRADGNHRAAVAAACDRMRGAIRLQGILQDGGEDAGRAGLDFSRVEERGGEMWTSVAGCEIRIVRGRVEEVPGDSRTAVVLPCNEYFDDHCAHDTKSAMGAYVNRVFEGRVGEFIELCKQECLYRHGPGVEEQKTADERALSFGAGKSVLLLNPLGNSVPVALISTSTQRCGQGIAAKISYLFDGICDLVSRLVDARLNRVVMPILGAGHGRIDASLALVGLLLAVAEAARYAQGGQPLRSVTIVVFQRDAASPAEVDPVVIRRALALAGSRE